jgi:hypothetical protein
VDAGLSAQINELSSPRLRLRKSGAPVKPRKFLVLAGIATSLACGAFLSCIHNCELAILYRVLHRKVPSKGYVSIDNLVPDLDVNVELSEFSTLLKGFLSFCAPMSYDSFIDELVGSKKTIYQQALEEFSLRGFRPSDAWIRMFIKYEKDIRELKPNRIPRAISPAGFVYLLLTGVYVKAVEKLIYDAINKTYGYRVVMKGLNFRELAQDNVTSIEHMDDPVFVDLDVEKLDASIFSGLLAWSHDITTHPFVGDEQKNIKSLLNYQLKSNVRGRTSDGWFSYKVNGTLTSGQMNTSLVGILVVCGILHKLTKRFRFCLKNAGDDCRIIVERKQLGRFIKAVKDRFALFNMFVTIEVHKDMRQSNFCQTHLIRVGGEWTSTRIPESSITKDAVCVRNYTSPAQIAAWIKAVGLGGMANHGGIPVLQNFYRACIRIGNDRLATLKLSSRQKRTARKVVQAAIRERQQWGPLLWGKFSEPLDQTRLDYFVAFGTTPEAQLLLENFYDNVQFDWELSVMPVYNNYSSLF